MGKRSKSVASARDYAALEFVGDGGVAANALGLGDAWMARCPEDYNVLRLAAACLTKNHVETQQSVHDLADEGASRLIDAAVELRKRCLVYAAVLQAAQIRIIAGSARAFRAKPAVR